MATVHRISEELFVDSFDLIALHSNMECYALAYNLNQVAQIRLVRSETDLEKESLSYPIFEYKDDINGEEWYLVSNVVHAEEKDKSEGLFDSGIHIKSSYLLQEKKEINYFLKLYPEDNVDINKTINAIRSIPRVSMAYQLSVDDLKSKRNLIF